MKVLHVIPSLGPLRGGPSFALPRMARGLAEAGIEVHIATTNDNGSGYLDVPLETPIVDHGVTTYYFQRQHRVYTISRSLKKWLQQHINDYDLVHIHSLFSYSSTVAGSCARRANVPYLVRTLGHLNCWGMNKRRIVKQLSLSLVENRLLQGAALAHYTSEQEKVEAAASGITVPCCVLPLGIEHRDLQQPVDCTPLLARYPQLENCFVFLFLSRLHEKKGLDLLLPAFAEVHRKHPKTALILAGDGDDSFIKNLGVQIEALNLNNAVVQTGFVEGKDKLMVLHGANAFVLPSYSENFANAVVEAMAVGLPVIVSDQVGVAATLQQAEAGIIIRCHVEDLRKAMETLLMDESLRASLSGKGKKLVEDHFSIEATTRALITQYENILQSRQSRK
jgi:glycosyltransferase involved in cell wall biosynthesis